MIYLIDYKGGDIDYVEAKTKAEAKKLGKRLHPGKDIWDASVSEVMRGMELTDWTRLTIGCICVKCASCKSDVCPWKVFGTKAPVDERPCHDTGGNVFCNPTCRQNFIDTYGSVVTLVRARDYDNWMMVDVPVPVDPVERVIWDREWALVPHNDEVIYISRKRYTAMVERSKVTKLIKKGTD